MRVVLSPMSKEQEMILGTMKFAVLPAKHSEFLQTVQALAQSIRQKKGCFQCFACRDVENENIFHMIQWWETQESLHAYLQSDLFEVLLGTKNFMTDPWEIYFNLVSSTIGAETVKNARKGRLIPDWDSRPVY